MHKAHKLVPKETVCESYCPLIAWREFPSGHLIVHEVWPTTSNNAPKHLSQVAAWIQIRQSVKHKPQINVFIDKADVKYCPTDLLDNTAVSQAYTHFLRSTSKK